jgi:hypothetical protein
MHLIYLKSVPLSNFTHSITNNNFIILTIHMYNICVNRTSENTTAADINYKYCNAVNGIEWH